MRRKSIQAEETVNTKVSVWKQAGHGPGIARSQWAWNRADEGDKNQW